eukprot:3214742-Amphidinium_carterae.1
MSQAILGRRKRSSRCTVESDAGIIMIGPFLGSTKSPFAAQRKVVPAAIGDNVGPFAVWKNYSVYSAELTCGGGQAGLLVEDMVSSSTTWPL